MTGRLSSMWQNLIQRRAIQRWHSEAEMAMTHPVPHLRRALTRAWALRHKLDRVIHIAENRLALPMVGGNIIRRQFGTDWAWRPTLWLGPIPKPGIAATPNRTVLCDGITIFHDCKHSELTARQIRNNRASDIAPFGFRLDVFRFDGSFLSMALELPSEAVNSLKQKHIIRVDMIVEMEKPLEIFARLNVKHGPNVEQIVREMPLNQQEVMVEFDLGYSKLNERRVEKIWLDLIFEGPEMNQIILRDLTLTRRPRAAL
jgi:hypothetical protein